jgi:DNA adenine methylase
MKPFLKWAGGKRWFTALCDQYLPATFNRYIEPFLGSGALYFHLEPGSALLGDSNRELIQTYQAVRDDWQAVVAFLREYQERHNPDYYYQVRRISPTEPAEQAARLIYLNRTCWNGLYRVNLKGQFNVPIGTRTTVLFDDDDFEAVARLLQAAELRAADFETLIDEAEQGDLVFADPPYTVSHNANGFIKYNERLFSWTDQERLYEALVRAKGRGVRVLATNTNHHRLQELYAPEFKTTPVARASVISGKSSSRGHYQELIIQG